MFIFIPAIPELIARRNVPESPAQGGGEGLHRVLSLTGMPQVAQGGRRMSEKDVRIPKQKRSIEKKERIVEAAFRVFSRKGYFETYTDDIAAEAGLSVGSVYAYFHDKKDVLLACLERNKQTFISDMCREIAGASKTGDISLSIKNILFIQIKLHTSYTRLLHDEINSLQYRDEDIRRYFADTEDAIMEAMSGAIELQGYTFAHAPEQLFMVSHMVDSIQDELAFGHNPAIHHDILIDECTRLVAAMLVKKEGQ